MQLHRALPDRKLLDGAVLTIGTFDGVHRGHQLLAARLREEAARLKVPSVVLTFEDMPICYFRPDLCPPLLTLADEKIEAWRQTEVDHLFIVPFDEAMAQTSACDFIARWKETIGLQLFLGGPDSAIGREREGTVEKLAELGRELGFEARSLEEKLLDDGEPISSTRVRGEIQAGRVESATQMLGHNYTMTGQVVGGDQIGRTIGVPTINIEPHPRKCVPAHGVYAVTAHFHNKIWPAVLNIGVRPTVNGTRRQIEFHVLDVHIETPPEAATLEFIARIRDERRFDGLDSLRDQLKQDVQTARDMLPPR